MEHQKSSKSNPNLAVAHGSMDFFHYLHELPKELSQHFESYCSMLDNACGCYWLHGSEPKWIPTITDVQSSVTKPELTTDRHWHRATVHIYPARQTESGHLVMKDSHKEALYTLLSLIIPGYSDIATYVSITAVYSPDSMVYLTMYSPVGGRLRVAQTGLAAGQEEQSASVMLYIDAQSPCCSLTERSNWQTQQRYRCTIQQRQASPATQPHEKNSASETGCSTMLINKHRLDSYGEHLVGELGVLISPLYKKRWIALDGIYGERPHGLHKPTNHYVIFPNLLNVSAPLNYLRLVVSSAPSDSMSMSIGADDSVLPCRSSDRSGPDSRGQQAVPHEDDCMALHGPIDASYYKQSLQSNTMSKIAEKTSQRSTNYSFTRWQRDRGPWSQAELQGLAQVPPSKNIGNSFPLFLKNRVRVSTQRAASWDTPGGRIEEREAL